MWRISAQFDHRGSQRQKVEALMRDRPVMRRSPHRHRPVRLSHRSCRFWSSLRTRIFTYAYFKRARRGCDVFSLALAIQMLLWCAAQPFIGAIADRFGPSLVLSAGAVLYALGLATMTYATTPAMLHLTAGTSIGFGLAGLAFSRHRHRCVWKADAQRVALAGIRRRTRPLIPPIRVHRWQSR